MLWMLWAQEEIEKVIEQEEIEKQQEKAFAKEVSFGEQVLQE